MRFTSIVKEIMASGKTAAVTWRGAQVRGTLMVCPTTMMSTMKTASSTRMQHIATATIVCSAWRADRTRPRSALPLRDVRRDEILIRWPLASLDGQSYKSDLQVANVFSSSARFILRDSNVMDFRMRTSNRRIFS